MTENITPFYFLGLLLGEVKLGTVLRQIVQTYYVVLGADNELKNVNLL